MTRVRKRVPCDSFVERKIKRLRSNVPQAHHRPREPYDDVSEDTSDIGEFCRFFKTRKLEVRKHDIHASVYDIMAPTKKLILNAFVEMCKEHVISWRDAPASTTD